MALMKEGSLAAGSRWEAFFGRKLSSKGKMNPLLEEPRKNGRKPFSRMSREEIIDYAKQHVHVKTRTLLERHFPGFYLALKHERNKGLIEELFPVEKLKKPRREKRDLKNMSDQEMIHYFKEHYAGKIKSWGGLAKMDSSFYINFVQIRELNTTVNLKGEPLKADGI